MVSMTVEAESERILVVDDDESLCRSLQLVLNKKGYDSETALSGEEAISKASEKSYNLALLDIRLPDMQGLELLTQLSEIQSDMDMILVTGYASVETALAAVKTKAAAYIVKPIDMQELLSTIEKVLERQHLIQEKDFAESALRRSEEQYRSLFQNAQVGMFRTRTSDGKVIDCNETGVQILGYSSLDEVMVEYIASEHYVDPRVRQQMIDLLSKDGSISGFQAQITQRDGTPIWVEFSTTHFPDEGYLESVVIDITERKKAEDALRESEERYRTLVKSLHDNVFVFDQQDRYSEFYYSDENLLYVSPEEFIGKHIADVLPEDVASLFIKCTADIRRNGLPQVIDYPLLIADELRWFSSTLSLHEDCERIVAVVREITDRKRVEEALRESEDKYHALFDTAPIAIAMTDIEGRYLAANQGMENLTGYSWHELENMTSSTLYHDIQDRKRALSILNEEGRLQDFETKLIKKNGQIFSCLLNWDLTEIDGQMVNSVTLRDISARKQAEEDLRVTADTAMLYLDIMGHDIRNQLMSIVMGTEILRHHDLGPEVSPIFELIVESVLKSQGLIDRIHTTRDLLNMPLSDVSLSDALRECMGKAAKEFEDAAIQINIEVSKATVRANKYISYLFGNLLDNAISHNPRAERHVWLTLKEADNGYEVTISDDGTGIPDGRKESLFDPERRFGGVGIHQAKSILKKYNGRISVHDRIDGEPEQGAKFRIWFPISTPRP